MGGSESVVPSEPNNAKAAKNASLGTVAMLMAMSGPIRRCAHESSQGGEYDPDPDPDLVNLLPLCLWGRARARARVRLLVRIGHGLQVLHCGALYIR